MSFVYFIQAGEAGPIKIGRAVDVDARLATLQTGSAEELYILATTPGGYREERELHRRFRSHRIRGEWFAPAPEILAFVETIEPPVDLFSVEALARYALTTGPLEESPRPCPTWTAALALKLAPTEPKIAAALAAFVLLEHPREAAAHLDEAALCRLFEAVLNQGAERKASVA